jgi:acetyl esterase/lipase
VSMCVDFGGESMRALRRLLPALLGVALLVTGLSGCDWPEGTRYVHRVFEQTEPVQTEVYRTTTTFDGQTVELELDIYEPAGDRLQERPAVMWMFGGAWIFGSKEQMTAYAVDSALRGYVGVTIDYRIRSGGGDIIAAAWDAYDDAVAAVAWLKEHAAEYGIDPDAIVAGGISAGAINAMHLLYAPGTRGPETSPVAGAVSISGLSFVTPSGIDPPSIMHHGTNDPIVPHSSATTTCNAAKAAGSECNWLEYQGAGHEIGATRGLEIQETSADLIFERVLWGLGYRAGPA